MALDAGGLTTEFIAAFKAANPDLGAPEEAQILASINALATAIVEHIKNNAVVVGTSDSGGAIMGTVE